MKEEKRNKTTVVIFTIALIIGIVIGYAISESNKKTENYQYETGDNILQNSGFETLIEGEPAYWFKAYYPEENITMKYDTETTYHGNQSATINKISNTETNNESINNNWAQTINLVPTDKIIELSGYIKTANVGDDSVAMVIQCWDENSEMIGFGTTQGKYNISGTTDWTQYTASTRVPLETEHIIIRLVLVGTGQVWFDDVTLTIK